MHVTDAALRLLPLSASFMTVCSDFSSQHVRVITFTTLNRFARRVTLALLCGIRYVSHSFKSRKRRKPRFMIIHRADKHSPPPAESKRPFLRGERRFYVLGFENTDAAVSKTLLRDQIRAVCDVRRSANIRVVHNRLHIAI